VQCGVACVSNFEFENKQKQIQRAQTNFTFAFRINLIRKREAYILVGKHVCLLSYIFKKKDHIYMFHWPLSFLSFQLLSSNHKNDFSIQRSIYSFSTYFRREKRKKRRKIVTFIRSLSQLQFSFCPSYSLRKKKMTKKNEENPNHVLLPKLTAMPSDLLSSSSFNPFSSLSFLPAKPNLNVWGLHKRSLLSLLFSL